MKTVMRVLVVIAACIHPTLGGTPVLSVSGGSGGTPVADSNHGWQFMVNQPITVTHLGLFDYNGNGMSIAHPVGLFRLSDSALLTSGTISAGLGDVLLNGFRYVDTPDVTLAVGATYVISYYSATDNDDLVLTSVPPGGVVTDPVITLLLPALWGTGSGGLMIPPNSATSDPYRIGPNFQFSLVPEPTAPTLLGLGVMAFVAMRNRIGGRKHNRIERLQ